MNVAITKKRLEELEDIEKKMVALEAGGVDNKEREVKVSNVINDVIDALCDGVEEPAGSGCGFGVG